jgi:hypothetical protein
MDLVFRVLKTGLEFSTTSRDRSIQNHDAPTENPDKWLRRGIQDLDFDPYYFLATGKTSPEGWAVGMVK